MNYTIKDIISVSKIDVFGTIFQYTVCVFNWIALGVLYCLTVESVCGIFGTGPVSALFDITLHSHLQLSRDTPLESCSQTHQTSDCDGDVTWSQSTDLGAAAADAAVQWVVF